MVHQIDFNIHRTIFLAPFEKREPEAERRRLLPADSLITSGLTRFDGFEVAAVKMFRNWESEAESFIREPCPEEFDADATFRTVYGHPEGIGCLDALIEFFERASVKLTST